MFLFEHLPRPLPQPFFVDPTIHANQFNNPVVKLPPKLLLFDKNFFTNVSITDRRFTTYKFQDDALALAKNLYKDSNWLFDLSFGSFQYPYCQAWPKSTKPARKSKL
jgi:hypothetical protein